MPPPEKSCQEVDREPWGCHRGKRGPASKLIANPGDATAGNVPPCELDRQPWGCHRGRKALPQELDREPWRCHRKKNCRYEEAGRKPWGFHHGLPCQCHHGKKGAADTKLKIVGGEQKVSQHHHDETERKRWECLPKENRRREEIEHELVMCAPALPGGERGCSSSQQLLVRPAGPSFLPAPAPGKPALMFLYFCLQKGPLRPLHFPHF